MALNKGEVKVKIFAISDLHLSLMVEKPMDVFGGEWENYTEKIKENWQKTVSPEDIVLIAGDISWAMRFEEAKEDLKMAIQEVVAYCRDNGIDTGDLGDGVFEFMYKYEI